MFINSKYISSKEIISNVIRDNGFTGIDIDYGSILEFTAECLDLIGCPIAYINKVTDLSNPIVIEEYRGKLPSDLVQIRQTARFYTKNGTVNSDLDGLILDFTTGSIIQSTVSTKGCTLVPMRYSTDSFHIGLHCEDCIDVAIESDFTYQLNNDYIFTNFKEGYVALSYLAYPTDCDGFPMIPDNIKFKKAVAAYITERIDFKMWRRGDITDKVYQHSQQERNWYIGAAQSAGNIPSQDQMESFKNQWLRLIPKVNAHGSNFRTNSIQEQLRRK